MILSSVFSQERGQLQMGGGERALGSSNISVNSYFGGTKV